MIIYLLITFIIIVLSVIVFTPRFRRGLKINEPGVNFFLTLLATLIGVFIGITLSNYEEQRTENENVVKVLNFSAGLISNTDNYTRTIEELILKSPDSTATKMIKSNPIPFPDQYKSILENDFILRNISREYMNNVFNIIFDAQKIQDQVNNAEEKEAIAEFLEIYRLLLRQLHEHTMLESQYQNGEISRKSFSQKIRCHCRKIF